MPSPVQLIKLIRVYQWTKSGFVVLPFIFSDHLQSFFRSPFSVRSQDDFKRLLLAFLAFSFLASFGYVFNDWKDRDLDRRDVRKSKRPLASGAVSPTWGLALAALLLILAFLCGSALSTPVIIALGSYLVLNVLFYSLGGKQIVLLDVFIIATGFVLRVVVGAFALEVEASPWLLSCTFFLALFLGFSKRLFEVRSAPAEVMVGGSYTGDTLEHFINISASLAIMNYAMYSILGKHAHSDLYFTIPLVVLGIFRYYVLTHAERKEIDGNPSDVLLSDFFLIADIAVWVVLCAVLILFRA